MINTRGFHLTACLGTKPLDGINISWALFGRATMFTGTCYAIIKNEFQNSSNVKQRIKETRTLLLINKNLH